MYTSCREFDQFIASFTPVCMDCFQMLRNVMQALQKDCYWKIKQCQLYQNENQNELYWPGMFTHSRNLLKWQKLHSATEWQKLDRTQKTKEQYTNIQNGKNTYTIQTIMCVQVWHVQIWNEKNKYVWWINNCIIAFIRPDAKLQPWITYFTCRLSN